VIKIVSYFCSLFVVVVDVVVVVDLGNTFCCEMGRKRIETVHEKYRPENAQTKEIIG